MIGNIYKVWYDFHSFHTEFVGRVVHIIKAYERPTIAVIFKYFEIDETHPNYKRSYCRSTIDRLIFDKGNGHYFIVGYPNTYLKLEKLNFTKEEKIMEESKFWVFNPKGSLLKCSYSTIEEATKEAERIAGLENDTEILVVRTVVGITYPSKQFIYRNYKK